MNIPATIITIALASTVAGAQELGGMLNPRLGELVPRLSLDTEYYADQGIDDQDADLGFTRYRLTALLPLAQNERGEAGLAAGFEAIDLATRAALQNPQAPLPDHLYDLRLGGFKRWRVGQDRIAAIGATIGSTSDRPFDSLEEVTLDITAGYWIPTEGRNGHIFLLNYSSNREFLPHIPIPGYGYLYRPDPNLTLFTGLPATLLRWRIAPAWQIEASYVIPRTVFAEIQFKPLEPLAFYANFAWDNDRWYRADRQDEDDRIFYYEKRVSAGLRLQLADRLQLDLGGGYGFDRFFFEGEEYSDRSQNRISVGDGPFLAAEARLTF